MKFFDWHWNLIFNYHLVIIWRKIKVLNTVSAERHVLQGHESCVLSLKYAHNGKVKIFLEKIFLEKIFLNTFFDTF